MPSEVLLISAQALLLSMQLGAFHGVGQITSEWHNLHAIRPFLCATCKRVYIYAFMHIYVHKCAYICVYMHLCCTVFSTCVHMMT